MKVQYFKQGKTHKQIDAAEVACGLNYFKIFDANWSTKEVTCKKCLAKLTKRKKG